MTEMEDGIVTDFNDFEEENANLPSEVTNVGMFKCSIGWISTCSSLMIFTEWGSSNEEKQGKLFTILFPSRLQGFAIVTDDNELHPDNAQLLKYETDDGMEMDVNDEQSLNVWTLIQSTDDGIITDFNELHPSKASEQITDTDVGISIVSNDMHSLKVFWQIFEIDDGIKTDFNELHS